MHSQPTLTSFVQIICCHHHPQGLAAFAQRCDGVGHTL